MAYARIVDTTTGKIKDVGRLEATMIIKKAEKKAVQAMKKYEGEVVLYGIIHKDKPGIQQIHLVTPTVQSKKYIVKVYSNNKHVAPLYVLRKTKR